MTVIQDLRTRARHRGYTPWQLIQKIGRLEREADDTTCELVALATEIGELKRERNQLEAQLDTAGIELSGAREDLTAQTEELIALRQFKANVLSVSSLPVAPEAPDAPAPTAERFDDGPVLRAGKRPVPAWAPESASETTQSIPVAQLPHPAPAT